MPRSVVVVWGQGVDAPLNGNTLAKSPGTRMPCILDALETDQMTSDPFRLIAKSRAQGRSKCLWVVILLCALLVPAGCLLLPIPTQERKVLAGKAVSEEQLAFIVPDVTTRSEVVSRLGDPDVIWEEARLIAYNWEIRQGVLVWAIGAYYSGAAGVTDIPKHYMLLIRFDEQDRVRRFERAVRPPHKSYGDFLKEWVGRSDRRHRED